MALWSQFSETAGNNINNPYAGDRESISIGPREYARKCAVPAQQLTVVVCVRLSQCVCPVLEFLDRA